MGAKGVTINAGDISSLKGRSLKQSGGSGSGSGFNSNNQGSLLSGLFNLGSLGLNFGSLQSQITAALLSGNQDQASNLIKQGLQGGNTGAVSQALASASANVSCPDAGIIVSHESCLLMTIHRPQDLSALHACNLKGPKTAEMILHYLYVCIEAAFGRSGGDICSAAAQGNSQAAASALTSAVSNGAPASAAAQAVAQVISSLPMTGVTLSHGVQCTSRRCI